MQKRISASKYSAIHSWLRYHYGKAKKCAVRSCSGKSINYQWALKKGKEYDYKRSNFTQMCVSCHGKYDTTEEKRKLMRLLNKNTHKTYCIHGHKLEPKNVYSPNKNKWRHCRECKRRINRVQKKRKREKRSINKQNKLREWISKRTKILNERDRISNMTNMMFQHRIAELKLLSSFLDSLEIKK